MVYGTLHGGVVVFNTETNVITARHFGESVFFSFYFFCSFFV
jgi:hypothetical protein